MTRFLSAFLLISSTMFGTAGAIELTPGSGYSVRLPHAEGVVYYTVEPEGFRVVTTLASTDGTPLRFVATLAPGQRIVLSVPQAVGQPPVDLEIQRDGEMLRVGEPDPELTASAR